MTALSTSTDCVFDGLHKSRAVKIGTQNFSRTDLEIFSACLFQMIFVFRNGSQFELELQIK